MPFNSRICPRNGPKRCQKAPKTAQYAPTPRNQAQTVSWATWLKIQFRGHLVHPQPPSFCGFQASESPNETRRPPYYPVCAQWCIFSIVRANFQKYDLYSEPIARALPRYIVPFFKFFKTGKCFKTMLFPVFCVSQKPLAFQKYSLLLIQPKTHAKTLSERSEKCATVQVLTGTDSVARATYLQRVL